MTTFNIETPAATTAATSTPEPSISAREKYLADRNADADRLMRIGNGINDEVVFPRLRMMGVAESDLHRSAMRLVRQVQYGRDVDGVIANLLGVTRSGINGTTAVSEVV